MKAEKDSRRLGFHKPLLASSRQRRGVLTSTSLRMRLPSTRLMLPLTTRQLEVLRLLAAGRLRKEIANALNV